MRPGWGPVLAALLLLGCGGRGAHAPLPPASPLHVSPIAGLAPSAGLLWLLDVRPSEIAAHAELFPAIHLLVPEERFSAFAAHNGGLDLRTMNELTIAGYGKTTMYLARAPLDPARVERAFTQHLVATEGRAIDRQSPRVTETIVRAWGKTADDVEQLAIFGVEGAALERGKPGPLRAAELFAEGRLKKASPALRAAPLARVAQLLGESPIRAFAPGPFRGEWAQGLGGLMAASTALGIGVRIATPRPDVKDGGRFDVTLVLLGAWNEDAPAAADRLASVFDVIANDSLGKLTGLHQPLIAPKVHVAPEGDAIILEVSLDATMLARGLHFAVDAQVAEVMSYGAPASLTPPSK